MDRKRFDALARMLATMGTRRATLGAFLGVSLYGQDPDVWAKRGKSNDHGHGGQDVQGEGRPGAKHKAHHQHQQTQRQRRQKRDRQDRHQEQGGDQKPEACCGTKQCAPPEPGSTRSDCDFEGQSFAGQDLNGTTFRQIDGRRANFESTDNRGSDFTGACLFLASFREARLAGAIWDGACLFAADFTAADLGDAGALDGAVLCGTIMDDGTRNDRDCGRLPRCCNPAQGGPPTCTTTADCPNTVCQSKWCEFPCQGCGGICEYEEFDGPSPNAMCGTVCCGGDCCPSNAYVCDEDAACCLPGSPTDCDQSGACAAACGENCAICVRLANGVLQCASNAVLNCSSCSSNADCPASAPQCVSGYTLRNTSVPLTAGQICRDHVLTASCATIFPC
jgi:hypothetical protein